MATTGIETWYKDLIRVFQGTVPRTPSESEIYRRHTPVSAPAMGTGSKVCSVILRLGELCCSVIVVGQLSRFFWLLNRGPDSPSNGRLIYAEVMSCLALICSIILIIPAKYSFYAWPLDLLFFISLMIAFGLLAAVSV